jgi:adenylyl-sulfate kinase
MDRGFTLWFTGLSGAGKSTLAGRIERELRARGRQVEVLDGDVVRTHLSKGLGFSREDRDTNILRIGFVCNLLARNGVVAIAAAISPYRATRDQVRTETAQMAAFVEVFVDCPLEECERRDVKGLYQQARDGQIAGFTGVSDPYEPPLNPEITVRTALQAPEASVAKILGWLEAHGYINPAVTAAVEPVAGAVVAEVVAVPVGANGANESANGHANGQSAGAYSAEEEAAVSDRLAALGYL